MTSTVTDAITELLLSASYDTLSTTVGVAVLTALAILLIQREVTRVLAPESAEGSGWAFDIALAPLLLAFLIIITVRFAELVL